MSRRHHWQLLLGIVVTAACLAGALWGFDRDDYAEIAASFRRARYWTLPAIVLLLAVFFWLKAIRWSLLLQPIRPSAPLRPGQILPALLVGFMGNNLLPAHLGDFLRAFVLGRQFQISRAAVLSTVLVERICDVAAILALLGWGLAIAPAVPARAQQTGLALGLLLLVAIVGIVIYTKWTAWFVRTTEAVLSRVPIVPAPVRAKACELLESGALGIAALRDKRLMAGIIATSLAQWALNICMIKLSLLAFDIDQPLSVAAVVMGIVAFGVAIPSTPGFFGIIELAFRVSLVPFGVAATDAIAASVYYHLISWGAVTLAGLLALPRAGLRLGQIEQAAERAEEGVADDEGSPRGQLPVQR